MKDSPDRRLRSDGVVMRLDYARADLWIVAWSRLERELRAFSCAKEPETVAWCESLTPMSVMWDIGANCGAYSLIAAHRGVHVVAVEPAIHNLTSLHENVTLNQLQDFVTVLPVALGRAPGLAGLTEGTEPGATHSLIGGTEPVLVLTIDQLVSAGAPAPQHMKIDVDGTEHEVLAGAKDALRGVESVLIEVTEDTRSSCEWLLEEAGLSLTEEHPHERSGVTNLVFRR